MKSVQFFTILANHGKTAHAESNAELAQWPENNCSEIANLQKVQAAQSVQQQQLQAALQQLLPELLSNFCASALFCSDGFCGNEIVF